MMNLVKEECSFISEDLHAGYGLGRARNWKENRSETTNYMQENVFGGFKINLNTLYI